MTASGSRKYPGSYSTFNRAVPSRRKSHVWPNRSAWFVYLLNDSGFG